MNLISFIDKKRCLKAAKELREWSELGGYETNVSNNHQNFDVTVSPEQCGHAADQFEAYSDEGGYYSNIVSYPRFSSNERDAILNIF